MSSWASQAVLFIFWFVHISPIKSLPFSPWPPAALNPSTPSPTDSSHSFASPRLGSVRHRRLSHSLLHQWLTSKPPSHLSHSPRLCISICQWSSEHQEIQCTSDQFAWNQFDKEPIYWSAILVNYFKFHCVSNFNTVITLQCLITLHTNKDQYGDRNP